MTGSKDTIEGFDPHIPPFLLLLMEFDHVVGELVDSPLEFLNFDVLETWNIVGAAFHDVHEMTKTIVK